MQIIAQEACCGKVDKSDRLIEEFVDTFFGLAVEKDDNTMV